MTVTLVLQDGNLVKDQREASGYKQPGNYSLMQRQGSCYMAARTLYLHTLHGTLPYLTGIFGQQCFYSGFTIVRSKLIAACHTDYYTKLIWK